ncbi:MAG: hypothetical protein ABI539_11650 [Acidobacteriota bacterium]
MKYLFIILAIAAVGAVFVWLRNRKSKVSVPTSRLPFPMPQLPYHMISPAGAHVFSVRPIANDDAERVLAAIDAGIRNCIAGLKPEWTGGRDASEFLIAFVEPQASTEAGEPSLMIHGIESAGTVFGVGNDGYHTPTIVVPYQDGWQYLGYLSNEIWYEGEHYVEWINDPAEFYKFAVAADVHPHRPL